MLEGDRKWSTSKNYCEEFVRNGNERLEKKQKRIAKAILGRRTKREKWTHRLDTEEGKKELEELFASLCEEFETTPDNVTYVTLVATDDSAESLIERGY